MKLEYTTREQYDLLTRDSLLWKDVCPFCRSQDQIWRTIWKGRYWYILRNMFPYSGNEDHLLVIPYDHKVFSHELTSEELAELRDVYQFMREYFWAKNYFSTTRETFSNRSIEHLHMHFIPWKLQWKYLRKMLELQWFPIQEKLEI